mgnify:CR=1 FL=1
MTYKTHILLFNPQWRIDWRYKQFPRWFFRILRNPNDYHTWYKHEICRVYRERTKKGDAFADSFDSLPKLTDKIPTNLNE